MFVFWYFTLYAILLLNGKYFDLGVNVIMVFYAMTSDLLLYSLASQWVKKKIKKNHRNVGKLHIHRTDSIDPGIYKNSDAYDQIKKDIENGLK